MGSIGHWAVGGVYRTLGGRWVLSDIGRSVGCIGHWAVGGFYRTLGGRWL